MTWKLISSVISFVPYPEGFTVNCFSFNYFGENRSVVNSIRFKLQHYPAKCNCVEKTRQLLSFLGVLLRTFACGANFSWNYICVPLWNSLHWCEYGLELFVQVIISLLWFALKEFEKDTNQSSKTVFFQFHCPPECFQWRFPAKTYQPVWCVIHLVPLFHP